MLLVCLESRIRWKSSHAYMHNCCNSATQRGSVNMGICTCTYFFLYITIHVYFQLEAWYTNLCTDGVLWGGLQKSGPSSRPQPCSPAAPPTPPWPGTAPSPAAPSHLWDYQSELGAPCPTPSVSRS